MVPFKLSLTSVFLTTLKLTLALYPSDLNSSASATFSPRASAITRDDDSQASLLISVTICFFLLK